MDEWMNGWMNGWMNEWMNGWMDEWMDERTNERKNERTSMERLWKHNSDNRSTGRETCPSATMSTINPTLEYVIPIMDSYWNHALSRYGSLTSLHSYLHYTKLGRIILKSQYFKIFRAVAILLIPMSICCSHKIVNIFWRWLN